MNNTVKAHGFILEFLSTSCAITHENSINGIGMPFFRQLHEHHS
ncbi:RAxF-45 family protein [Paenisporosarcina indica]